MNEAQQKLHDLFESYKHTSGYKDSAMMPIVNHRDEYEKILNKMWRIYTMGNMKQVVEYKKQVQAIKDAGLVVKRNKQGLHKIVYEK